MDGKTYDHEIYDMTMKWYYKYQSRAAADIVIHN